MMKTAENSSETKKNVHIFGKGQYTTETDKTGIFHDMALFEVV